MTYPQCSIDPLARVTIHMLAVDDQCGDIE
jgi:hypothetical protein